jgi:Flp pilus assembly protein TadD
VGLWALLILVLANLTPSGFHWRMGLASGRLAEIWGPLGAGQEPGQTTAPFTSVQHRTAMWGNTLAMIRDHPMVGVGFANHAVYYPAYVRATLVDREFGEQRHPDFAHNDYLQLTAELGLVGVALGAWFLVALGTTLRSALGGGSADRRAAAALVLSLAGLLTDALFSFPFERALPPLSIMVLAGIAVNLGPSPRRSVALSRKGTGAVATLVLAGVLGLGWASWNRLAVDRRLSVMVGAEKRQDWPTILSVGQGILRLDPHQKDALLLVGAANVGMGRPQEAIERLRALLATHPYEMNALGNLALAYAQVGQWTEAIDCYDHVLRMVPHHARTHYNRARALEGAGRGAEAQAAYEQASELDPTVPTYAMRAGLSALRAGAYEKALISLRRAIEIDPSSAAAHKALGVVLFEILGRREEGRPHLERALALNPQIPDAERIRALLDGAAPR